MQQYADIYSLQRSSFVVNKYLHTVASVGFLFTLNYDARNRHFCIYKVSGAGVARSVYCLY